MSIKKYTYDYNWGDASATIEIDTDKITAEECTSLLDFFSWNWDHDEPYDELGRLYCMAAIRLATEKDHNLNGVLRDFETEEGFPVLDGTYGIKLLAVSGIDLTDLELELKED